MTRLPQKKVILIGGVARTGSTLTDLILGNDPHGFSLGEVNRLHRPVRTHHFDVKCACGVYPCPVWEDLRHEPEAKLYDAVFERHDTDLVVDSSKSLAWIIDRNRDLAGRDDVEVENVFLYKTPVALFHSYWKRGDTDPTVHARRYRYYESAATAKIPFRTINYDWMVRDLDVSLPLICERLGLPWREGRERFWEKTQHHLWGSFGPREQLLADRERTIYVEDFGPDFESRRGEYERIFAADPDLRNRFEELERRDLRSEASARRRSGSPRRTRAYWEERLRELRARWDPAPYLDREASLIRDWRV